MKTRPSARDRLRTFFSENVGRVLQTHQLREIAGISDYARRIRELRDEEGMAIRTFKERTDLRPDEYVLENLQFEPVANPRIPEPLRKTALLRDGAACRFCGGRRADDVSPTKSSRFRLRIDYIDPLEHGGTEQIENIGVICSECAKNRVKARREGYSARELIALIRHAAPAVQREVYVLLKRSFEGQNNPP